MKTFSLAVALVLLGSGCAKASKEDCQKFAEHTIDLSLKDTGLSGDLAAAAKKEAMKGMEDVVKECDGQYSKAQVDCAIKAESTQAMAECDK